jgi:serine phosphatase RsbU (regulator of sigma subunit)
MKKSIIIVLVALIQTLNVYCLNKTTDSLVECSEVQLNAGMYDAAIESLMKVTDTTDNVSYKVFQRLSYIFMLKKDFVKSLDYANLALKVSKKTKNSHDIGWSYSRIANVLLETNDLSGAEKNYTSSINEFQKIDDKKSKSQAINNLGLLYQKQSRLDEAEKMFLEAYKVSKEIKYFMFQVYIENELGDLYRIKKQYNKSEEFFNLAVKGEKEAGYAVLSQSLFYNIHELYKEIGNYSKSLFYFEKYSTLSDSLNLINQNQRILDTETKFRTKEKEKEIVFLNKESDLQQAQIKKRNIILLLSGLIIIIIGGLVVVIQKARKKQVQSNIDLTNKNTKIEHQKKEIVDSINYAKRIQDASLGNPEKIKEAHANSAILFQPKDILSGDFYWFSKSENRFSFSVADCTGHGVPGAMMSMIGNNGLNDAVYNNKLSKPSEILEHLSGYVNKNFIKTDVDVKDGMDIAFCNLNTVTGELEYAGALNSLYICKANGEFLDIKADKNYIGQIDSTYTNHKIQLEKGDCIYIMSDGFVDQFGGENNKKFKISNLRTLIQNIHTQSAESQIVILKNAINSWMKNNEQTDDICLITAMF